MKQENTLSSENDLRQLLKAHSLINKTLFLFFSFCVCECVRACMWGSACVLQLLCLLEQMCSVLHVCLLCSIRHYCICCEAGLFLRLSGHTSACPERVRSAPVTLALFKDELLPLCYFVYFVCSLSAWSSSCQTKCPLAILRDYRPSAYMRCPTVGLSWHKGKIRNITDGYLHNGPFFCVLVDDLVRSESQIG